jgi:hypothetical protein
MPHATPATIRPNGGEINEVPTLVNSINNTIIRLAKKERLPIRKNRVFSRSRFSIKYILKEDGVFVFFAMFNFF